MIRETLRKKGRVGGKASLVVVVLNCTVFYGDEKRMDG